MDIKSINFDVPQYITEEINQYIKDCENGKFKYMKRENIKSLIGLAIVNNRITKEQGNYLKDFLQINR